MNKLYVIGNGFDLAHGLPTSYQDFHSFLELTPNGINFIESLEQFYLSSPSNLWSDFEENLGLLSANDILEEMVQRRYEFNENFDYDSTDDSHIINFLRDEYFTELLKFDEYLHRWIVSIDDISVKHIKYELKGNDGIFITFNYTKTLEKVYSIEKKLIHHIHGSVDNSPVMGHGKEYLKYFNEVEQNSDFLLEEFKHKMESIFEMFYKDRKKDVSSFLKEMKKHMITFTSEIDEIVILGHSLGKIDWPYFEYLQKEYPKSVWSIGYYDTEDLKRKKISVYEMGINTNLVHYFVY